jgi:hypothetical protein
LANIAPFTPTVLCFGVVTRPRREEQVGDRLAGQCLFQRRHIEHVGTDLLDARNLALRLSSRSQTSERCSRLAFPKMWDTLILDLESRGRVSLGGRPSKYTDEFKRDAVELVRSSGRSINDVARELGLCHETLRNWVRGGPGRARGSARPGDGLSHCG